MIFKLQPLNADEIIKRIEDSGKFSFQYRPTRNNVARKAHMEVNTYLPKVIRHDLFIESDFSDTDGRTSLEAILGAPSNFINLPRRHVLFRYDYWNKKKRPRVYEMTFVYLLKNDYKS